MKRLAIVLSVIILLAIFFPGLSTLAQSSHIPHENPATARRSPDLVALLSFYSDTFDLVASSQYQDAQSLLKELEQANIPDELQYIANRYNTLSQQLLTTLDRLESLLDEASILLSRNQISDAREKLDGAEATTSNAQFLLKDIEEATWSLADEIGTFSPAAALQIKQTYGRLEQNLNRLRQLIDELNKLQLSLTDRHQTLTAELIPTKLNLSITPASVFVGNSITASGILSDGNRPLTKRKLTLLLDDKPLIITTDLNGSYVTNITIPYEYVPAMTLNAIYVPSGDDIGTYQASKSLLVTVNTMFYPTLLEVSAPETAHPGLPIAISGQVSSTDGNIDRIIKVLLDNIQLTEATIRGRFSFEITPPPQTPIGEHSLTIVATPQGHYSGAVKNLSMDISMIPIQTEIQTPRLVIIPKPIQISGKVSHDFTPVQDARVSLAFGQSSTTTKTADDGSFTTEVRLPKLSISTPVSSNLFSVTTTTVELPLNLSLLGPQELTVTIAPVEPWYAPLQIKRWVFTVNPSNLALLLVAFVSLGLLVYNRFKTRPAAPPHGKVIPQLPAQELPAATPLPGPKYEFTGIKGRTLSAYIDGLETVEKATRTLMAPHTTIREFLKTATPRLPTTLKSFAELTTIAEVALYSDHRLDEAIATRAEQLTATIKEELHTNGAA